MLNRWLPGNIVNVGNPPEDGQVRRVRVFGLVGPDFHPMREAGETIGLNAKKKTIGGRATLHMIQW